MNVNFTVTVTLPQLDKFFSNLDLFKKQLNTMAKDVSGIKADNAKTLAALQNIAADIVALNDKIANAVSPEDLESLKAESADLAAKAEALAAETPDGPTEPGTQEPA